MGAPEIIFASVRRHYVATSFCFLVLPRTHVASIGTRKRTFAIYGNCSMHTHYLDKPVRRRLPPTTEVHGQADHSTCTGNTRDSSNQSGDEQIPLTTHHTPTNGRNSFIPLLPPRCCSPRGDATGAPFE